MKALLINGSPNQLGCTYTALSEVERILNENGIQSEILYLGKMPVAGCIACGTCERTGRCVFDDWSTGWRGGWTSSTPSWWARRCITPDRRAS